MRLIDADALIDRIKNPYEQAQVARWVNERPTIEPEKRTEKRTETHACDLISRQAAIDAIEQLVIPEDMCVFEILSHIELAIGTLPSAQPEEAIPVSWIESRIERFIMMDNAYGELTSNIMLVMLNEWKREQEGEMT